MNNKNKVQKNPMLGKVGGQALIEGVMMKGPKVAAMAVRIPSGKIDVEEWEVETAPKITKIPIIRGVVNFVSSMIMGTKCLSKSAEKSGMDDDDEDYEPSKFETFLSDKLGDNVMKIAIGIGTVLGLVMAIALFMILPSIAVKGINMLIPIGGFKSVLEGIIKIIIFVIYLGLVSKLKDIRRVFEYHGAEHKTIFCFEAGEELTPENVKKYSRFHPRCGTSFIIIVLVISIILSSFVTWNNVMLRTVIRLAFLPITMGFAYELIRFAGKHDNIITKIISWPGMMLQRLTTKEPDESQIEVAIAALKPCVGLKNNFDEEPESEIEIQDEVQTDKSETDQVQTNQPETDQPILEEIKSEKVV
ncbi:MAG: DUF1385 domain-containing protein [Oscillospiraceae bacterium]